MPRNDDILLDTSGFDDNRDSDGDGVSDAKERAEGTNPNDASDHLKIDPKLDPTGVNQPVKGLDPTALERDTHFNKAAHMPGGHSMDTGLAGLTNLDGTKLTTGPHHMGVGDDKLLKGHGDSHSPQNVQRDPLATVTGTHASGQHAPQAPGHSNPGLGTHIGTAPPGEKATTTNPGHDMSLVSAPGDTTTNDLRALIGLAPKTADAPKKDPAEEHRKNADPNAAEKAWREKTDPKKDTNPDADTGKVVRPTEEQLQHAVTLHGDNVHTMDGVAAGPQIDGGPPPPGSHHSPLVTDPSPEGGGTTSVGATSTTPTIHNPSSPDVLNPNSGLAPPPPGGVPQGGDRGSHSSADTAADSSGSDSQGIHAVGSDGAHGIQSVDTSSGDTANTTTDVRSHASDITLDHVGSQPTIDPKLDPTGVNAPHRGLDAAALERDTVFDKGANVPAGQTVDSGLTGLTNVDGTKLPMGPNHFGVGDDPLLQGHDANSPLNVTRDPLTVEHAASQSSPSGGMTGTTGGSATTDGTFGAVRGSSSPGESGRVSTPGVQHEDPAGADLSFHATNMNLVADGFDIFHPYDTGIKPLVDKLTGSDAPKAEKPDAGTTRPAGDTPVPKPAPKPVTPGGPDDYDRNPDADTGTAAPTQEQLAHVVALHGDASHTIDGVAAGPQVEGGPPPVNPTHSPLVTDPSPEGSSTLGTGSTTPTFHNPSSPDVVNPHDGLEPPTAGGDAHGGGGGHDGLGSQSSADTAVVADSGAADPTGIHLVSGGGPSAIQSTDDSAAALAPDAPVHDAPLVDAPAMDDGGDAVHTFATGFLADSPDDGGLAMPDVVDHSAALAPIEPMDHHSFVDQPVDDGGGDAPPTDLFGNDDTLDG